MKIVQINTTCGIGSTGKICVGISQVLTENNIENYILYSSKTDGYPLGIRCSNDRYVRAQALKARILGNYGFNSKKATHKIICELERIKPDLVHLHNLHGHDCNIEVLVSYLKKSKIKVIWTFHDCWAFTGYCTYFDMVKCEKWKSKCFECPLRTVCSWFFDKSAALFNKKKAMFKEFDSVIVTPSKWLFSLVKESFCANNRTEVIYNGIDLSAFHPINGNFVSRYSIPQLKKIVLGVAFGWGVRKGLDVFIELAKRLDPDKYQIVLVGTDNRVDKQLPPNIISIHRTHNQQELAEIYSAADVFVNPTREENYPTVNMESIACGTPVLTFRTGGSPEMLDETCGSVVDCDDIDALEKEIVRICEEKPYSIEQCINKAKEFDKNEKYKEYLELYERIISSGT